MDYRVILAALPTSVRGFVFHDSDLTPVIVLNEHLTREQNLETLKHELRHLQRGDLTNPDYHEYEEE